MADDEGENPVEISPLEYIRTATELHLNTKLSPATSPQIDAFLSPTSPTPRLFVYTLSSSPGHALASTESYPPDNDGCIAILNLTTSLYVHTLSPSKISSSSDSKKDPLLPLQMYTRHVILPAIRNSLSSSSSDSKTYEVLEEKLRELDIALGQCRRSTLVQIPHVVLTCPNLIVTTAQSIPSDGKINLDELELTAYLDDDTFLNSLQKNIAKWIADINAVTSLLSTTPFPTGESADLEEIKFWIALEQSFRSIRAELSKPEVQLTMQILKSAKRFLAVMALENNTNLDAAEKQCSEVCQFLRPYPAQNLAAARDWSRMETALDDVFEYVVKARYCRSYDLERVAKLIEASSDTLKRGMESVLRDRYKGNGIILKLTFEQFEKEVWTPTSEIFKRFDAHYEQFCDFFLDYGRKRTIVTSDSKTPQQILKEVTLSHKPLKNRLTSIHSFRLQHETLQSVVTDVLQTSQKTSKINIDPTILHDVKEAPLLLFATLDTLSLTPQGTVAFQSALEAHDRKIDAIENKLARLLRKTLENCEDAEDMFRVFARFHPLLSRPAVRNSVKEFQMSLIATVSLAVQKLQRKFPKYEQSSAKEWGRVRGIPSIAGRILWAKQMETSVKTLMKRMGNVLGPDWGQQLEGRTLKRSGEELLAKLDARAFLRTWSTRWESSEAVTSVGQNLRLKSFPILIVRIQEGSSGWSMKVNFDERSEELFRDVRYLKWLGHESDIPRTLSILSEEAMVRYPHAMILKSALRSYTCVRQLVTVELEPLVLPQLQDVRDSVEEAFDSSSSSGASSMTATKRGRVRWESQGMGEWVATLSEHVIRLEERMERLLRARNAVEGHLEELAVVKFDRASMEAVLMKVQGVVDELSLAGYTNLALWVETIDERMTAILVKRLEDGLKAWIATLAPQTTESKSLLPSTVTVSIPTITTEILLRNQEISASPSVPSIHTSFLNSLFDYIATVCTLPRPSSVRYEVFTTTSTTAMSPPPRQETFSNLVSLISPSILSESYVVIELCMSHVQSFVSQWLAYQSLWDTRLNDVTSSLQDLQTWQQLVKDTQEARLTLDATASIQEFGPVKVKYDKIQNKVNLKYDAWQRDLQGGFATLLAETVGTLYDNVVQSRETVENVTLDGVSGTDVLVQDVLLLQKSQNLIETWEEEIALLTSCEALLKKQRFSFSSDWTPVSQVSFQYHHLVQILTKRLATLKERTPALQQRIIAEDKASEKRINALLEAWEGEKPLRGTLAPRDALDILSRFEYKLKKEREGSDLLADAKRALYLDSSSSFPSSVAGTSSILSHAMEALQDLKAVWNGILSPHATLHDISNLVFQKCTPREVRKGLDDLLVSLRKLPNATRQYDPYVAFVDKIKGHLSCMGLLSDLKTDALKERHWNVILQKLKLSLDYTEVTVGDLWSVNLPSYKSALSEILTVAQGEMALEVFLKDVKETWMKQELTLVLYQNRIRLIKKWDVLFGMLDDHMAGLVHMKSSPYYRSVSEFREEGTTWENRLTKLRDAFDLWIDVQRRWVYLEGIFFSSADIKSQLPSEWTRFKNVDGEFVQLMRRVSARPYAVEVLGIENLQTILGRMGQMMGVVQRALGEYLERQRGDFSRFYFLGDDDLLEIIGNQSGGDGEGSGMGVVLSHLGKMFAGITSVRMAPIEVGGNASFDAMISKDGEIVPLQNKIDITPKMSVKDWLKQLEEGMHVTLSALLHSAVEDNKETETSEESKDEEFTLWAAKYPAQVMILATLINWSMSVDAALSSASSDDSSSLTNVLDRINTQLSVMATTVLKDIVPHLRKKYEQLITELVHQRDVTRSLLSSNVTSPQDFQWLYHLRYQYQDDALKIACSNASFDYGYEYLGIGERLVQTPLTDRCYLTLTQALHFRLGGNPFGPAGTGKTESVKALGAQLGRFVVVMNCDETFDFGAMGRLFCGLCQVGAWGCFDEFNRLEERVLSAVSQQILTIQRGLLERQGRIELLGREIRLHDNVGIFVTMNPGYAGRSQLPDNLKSLFRSVAMVVPDRKLIAQVMLYSQGIVSAETLADKVVTLFQRCSDEMSAQSHYDFGLRALKTLLVSAGGLKRRALEKGGEEFGDGTDEEALREVEMEITIQGACSNVVPKLVANDLLIFENLLKDVFSADEVAGLEDTDSLRQEIKSVCETSHYIPDECWMQKVLQLNQVIEMRHGVMLVGPSGVGKSSALNVLLASLERLDNQKGRMHVIDPKAMDKEGLYGCLDATTMEWTDGVFTSLLRGILANQKGEMEQRHWIVFDGDVDPEWAENLNSVLDDNKLLTLPSGERLSIPSNLRIILEVDSLAHATPATVSRCGMVWFSADTVTTRMSLQHVYLSLSNGGAADGSAEEFMAVIKDWIVSTNDEKSLVEEALSFALSSSNHVMTPSRERLLLSFQTLLQRGIKAVVEYNDNHTDGLPLSGENLTNYARKHLLHSILWGFTGSANWEARRNMASLLLSHSGIMLPSEDYDLTDYRVMLPSGEYELWSDSVPRSSIESQQVCATNVVITTTDTVRHTEILSGWFESRKPLLLCGPPGSGKTMTLTSVLKASQNVMLANLNFSSRTTPEVILKTFAQHCAYVRRGANVVLEPLPSAGAQTWLVIFCDEINLPEEDAYGTQRVIMFLRQLVERGGFWREEDNTWVTIDRIQFVGACNPPSDAGRVSLSQRFLRHAPLLLVDFPARDSLEQIYGTFNGGMMKLFPHLKGEMADSLTKSMVSLYLNCQQRFTTEMQPHYFFSPRELSRWVRGMYEAIVEMEALTREELVRIWAHEALRLFNDRLVEPEERQTCEELIDSTAREYFMGVNCDEALKRPIFYSTWMSQQSRHVSRHQLKDFLTARLKVFYEEELDVPLVVFDQVLEHILRIDRVIRQPMGHCLLVGDSGAGKTVLSKFVSWMNGLSIFQIKAHSRYGLDEFNEDLRHVMRRVGIDGEKICFIFDEANALGSGFLEAMNALLASGEVPGLFEGDDYQALMSASRDSAAREGVIGNSDEELWRRFTSIVQRNLHVVFTMNPSGGEWKNRSTTSPALFNRCVVDWFGTWGLKAMGEVGKEFTNTLDMGDAEAVGGSWGVGEGEDLMEMVAPAFEGQAMTHTLRQAVVAALVDMHNTTKQVAEDVAKHNLCRTYLSPRDYLALIQNFVTSVNQQRVEVEEEQLHVNAGLSKLRQTQDNVAELKVGLGAKEKELREKEILANNKLQQMVAEQNEAEKRKDEAEKKGIEIEKQQVAIDARKTEAQRDLDDAEPALLSAQNSVRSIKKRDLDEVRNLARPPNNVKLTLEIVTIMTTGKKHEWGDIRKMLSKSEFIPNIINYDVDKLSAKLIKLLKENYIDGNSELTVDSVTRSSKACGPLYKWAESQIKYSQVYNRVQPLRMEVEQLETEANVAKDEKERIETEVKRLEASIGRYKSDYATLIRDVEALKAEMKSVTTKVERAESLIKSTSHESDRWEKSSEGFQSVLRNLVGDGLLMAAFLTYSGFFDFKTRLLLAKKWRQSLDVLGIEFREELGMVEALSKASQRLHWQGMGLHSDSLSLENGVILERCVRFPLIIDPSGQAIDFIMNKFKDSKIQKTSFLDKAFMKTLAGAVRFGTALLVENVEVIDPVLNPILNREIQRTGGRSLVRIGTEDVDYSPRFNVILTTKDPAVKLTPDLCSRVTLVNFTVTPASLQSQSMSLILKSEKPEIEEQRINLLKLQGEQNVKLRELEEQMLSTISAVEGSILDDDRVVAGMETLMKEGAHVEEQISKSANIMVEVQHAISKFEPLSDSCRKLFVLLEAMREIHFLYEFSARTFMNVLNSVLKEARKNDENDDERLGSLTKSIFSEVAARVGRGLLSEDKLVFSVLLAKLSGVDNAATEQLENAKTIEEITAFIETVFGASFPWQGHGLTSLKTVTDEEIDATTPLMLCSAPGHDVSGRVEAMARETKHELASVAMGSAEGFPTAEKYIASASKRGTWVMLKNCHLCTDWLKDTLVKKLQTLGTGTTHSDFRIFITSEINPKLPTSLLHLSDVIIAEAPSGLKATLSRFFYSISRERFTDQVRNRLYLILGWVHAVIQERLRYVPAGWTEKYEFTEADAIHALDVIDSLVEGAAKGNKQQHVSPDKVPWDAIRSTLCKGVFGGRITSPQDQVVLDNLVESIFIVNCFDVGFKVGDGVPCLPESTSMKDCFDWVEALPSYTPPTWIGLDGEAEAVRSEMIARSVMKKVDNIGIKI
eukprot:CAMPEP_0172510176 /NCGR_PEP_ID=MMETSP1066-20121228/226876_1 /TAXON_ID=671091 /ORGANISM="Coscinodiscus wailesii, Strain CCMP2513" /LENGTH=4214 /DNA_ID=CAMNT_0013289037 /DNA_START=123 /DNA_END=12767 /DNA_ORIENTATION=+